MQRPHLQILLALAAAFAGAAAAAGADHAAVARYLADDVSSVVYLDLEKLNLLAIGEELEKLQLIAEPHLESVKHETAAIQAKYDQLTKLGARRAYLLVRASDIV